MAWLLDASKRPQGPARAYGGGSPQPPRWAKLDADVALMVVQRGARLSVQPVTKKEFETVLKMADR